MRKKNKKKIKKKTLKKKRRIKANSRKASRNESVDLQKIVGFKFQSLNKAYENFIMKIYRFSLEKRLFLLGNTCKLSKK